MDIIGARPRYRVDDGSGAPPVLGPKIVGLHAELLQRIGIRHGQGHVRIRIVVERAVQREVHHVAARSVGGEPRADQPPARPAVLQPAGIVRGVDAGQQQNELRGVPPVQRKLPDPPRVHDGLERGRLGVHRRHVRRHLDDLRHAAHVQREVDPRRLVDFQGDARPRDRTEPFLLNRDPVAARRQQWHRVVTQVVRSYPTLDPGSCVRHHHRRAGDNRARRVRDPAGQLRGPLTIHPPRTAERERGCCKTKELHFTLLGI